MARAFGKLHHVLTFAGMTCSHFRHLTVLSRPEVRALRGD